MACTSHTRLEIPEGSNPRIGNRFSRDRKYNAHVIEPMCYGKLIDIRMTASASGGKLSTLIERAERSDKTALSCGDTSGLHTTI